MPTAENAKLQYEAGQSSVAMTTLTDSGDHTVYTSSASYWSKASGFAPDVKVNGVINGGEVTPAAAAGNNTVDVAAILLNLNGVETSVAADTDVAITRPVSAVAKINSITVVSGGTVAAVAGTDGASTTFSSTRGGAGGPPFIPVDSVEIAQVRVISDTDAAITASEIYQVPGTSCEKANYPTYEVDYENGEVEMASALPLDHTGSVTKRVYASYATAVFADVTRCKDFVPAENSATVNSEQYYGGTIASTSVSLGQSSFTAFLDDGINDAMITNKGESLWFKYFPDRLKSPYHLLQGRLDVVRSFPVDGSIQAACTVSCEAEGTEHAA